MLNDLITLYCVKYDPFYCTVDPERIWRLIESHGGAVHAGAINTMDFYVPPRLITQVLLMDSGLTVRKGDCYI